MHISITSTDYQTLKKALREYLPFVQARDRAEALARGVGMKSNSALTAEIKKAGNARCVLKVSEYAGFLVKRNYCAPSDAISYLKNFIEALKAIAWQQPRAFREGIRREETAVDDLLPFSIRILRYYVAVTPKQDSSISL